MNDLDLIASLTPDAPLPGPDELAPTRDRLTAAIRATISTQRPAGAPVPSSPATDLPRRAAAGWRGRGHLRLRWPARRLALTAGGAAAVVAAIAAPVVVVPGHGGPPAVRPGAVPPTARSASPLPGPPQPAPTINVAAVRFLQHAAAVVRQQPADAPGPDQLVYTEVEGPGGTYTYQT